MKLGHHVMTVNNLTSRRPEVCYTVDVLSDGSEFTGQGTLFLSLWKKPRDGTSTNATSWLEEAMELNSPLGRYAISGVGDGSSRLAADQRFKLAPTRAVFAPTCDSLDGLSALLLALSSSGAPSLHIASTRADIMEELATTVLGSRRGMNISNCQVPEGDGWWQVFIDPYLTVHGSRRDPTHGDQVTFLLTVHSGSDTYTLALLPPGCSSLRQSYNELVQKDLPLVNSNNNNNSNNHPVVRITALIALDPQDTDWETVDLPNCVVMVTKPQVAAYDPGILERSQHVIDYLSNVLPQSFVQSLPKLQHDHAATTNRCSRTHHVTTPMPFQLVSGTSIIFVDELPREMNRRRSLDVQPTGDDWASTIASLRTFQQPTVFPCTPTAVADENEIDLDDDEDENEVDVEENEENDDDIQKDMEQERSSAMAETRSPMIVILGTGCATPSSVRGASAHALIFPSTGEPLESDIFLLDCGEGVTTMLTRYGPTNCQRRIRGVWISHAHLDHYGGLATLLRIIDSTSSREDSFSDQAGMANVKRRKITPRSCWVMAPPKVLRYLDLCLDCHHGRHKINGNQVFEPLLHHDPTIPPGPWSFFQSIKVPHNCFPAYALLVGWPAPRSSDSTHQTSWFCFSGDTRPSDSLVHTCQSVRRSGDRLFLLHEATFEDVDQEQAILKKHSTVSEAISIAKDIRATRLLLTHFSQRYVSIQSHTVSPSDEDFRVGLAMDGLRVMLE